MLQAIDPKNAIGKIIGKKIMKDNSKNKVIIKWEQENYPGDYPATVTLTKEFNNKQEADKWIKEMQKSANDINRRFDLIGVK